MKHESGDKRKKAIEEELIEASLSIREEEWEEQETASFDAGTAGNNAQVDGITAGDDEDTAGDGREDAARAPEETGAAADGAAVREDAASDPAAAGEGNGGAAARRDEDGAARPERKQPRSRKGKPYRKAPRLLAGAGVFFGVLVLAYGAGAFYYRNAYLPNTVINGMDAGGSTVEEVKEQLASVVDGYSIRLIGRDGEEEQIEGTQIGLHTVFDGQLESILQVQNPLLWGLALFQDMDADIDTVLAYDEEAFEETLDDLVFFDEDTVRPYQEAYLSDYVSGQGYAIIPADPGTEADREVFSEALSQAVLSLQQELSLELAGCYVYSSDEEAPEELVSLLEELNRYTGTEVTYTFGSSREVLDGDTIHTWISLDEDGRPVLDGSLVKAYVAGLAETYNTAYTKRKFMTSYGREVEVSGVYGWRIDQTAETAALVEIILAGESQTREPEYSQTAASHDGNDYGDTYAEVNLTAQHMFFYKDGVKILESDFVSGDASKNYTTPAGLFSLTYKQRDAVLRGEGYASPVKFWMPFNGGIGFHDASWRNQFGGTIYKTNGSHGCINMPYEAAKTLYENVYAGMPVICYNLEGTESTAITTASGSAQETTAAATSAETQAAVIETQAEETAQTQAAEETADAQAEETVQTQTEETAQTQTEETAQTEAAEDSGETQTEEETAAVQAAEEETAAEETEYGPWVETADAA